MIADARAERGSGRVECQTLFCTAPGADARFERAGFTGRARHYMRRDLARAPAPGGGAPAPGRAACGPSGATSSRRRPRSSTAATRAARTPRSTSRTRRPRPAGRFVDTLVVRSGCGRFDPEASRIVEGPRGPVGVLIASRLSRANGHVCQVSVAPEAQGRGLGRALVTAALRALREQGLASATLSVTVGNERAHRLYELLGFRVQRDFAAHAWVRPPARIELPA